MGGNLMHRRSWSLAVVLLILVLPLALGPEPERKEPAQNEKGSTQEAQKTGLLRKKILKLLEVQHGSRSLKDQFLRTVRLEWAGMPESFLDELLTDEEFEELTDVMVLAYLSRYTEEEIDQLLAFYETPLGSSVAEKLSENTEGIVVMAQAWSRRHAPRLMERTEDLLREGKLPSDEGPFGETLEKLLEAPAKYMSEMAAIVTLEHLAVVQMHFRQTDEDGDDILNFASSLEALHKAGLISGEVASGKLHGYIFSLTRSEDEWKASATPEGAESGSRSFIICTDGVVRFSLSGEATCSSPALR